jgi:hypothetical protein
MITHPWLANWLSCTHRRIYSGRCCHFRQEWSLAIVNLAMATYICKPIHYCSRWSLILDLPVGCLARSILSEESILVDVVISFKSACYCPISNVWHDCKFLAIHVYILRSGLRYLREPRGCRWLQQFTNPTDVFLPLSQDVSELHLLWKLFQW